MLELLKSYFEQQNWKYSYVDDETKLNITINGENGSFECHAGYFNDETHGGFIFLSIVGSDCPDNKKIQMAELLTRLNFDQYLGNFELDFETGEIRYKTSLVYNKIQPDLEMVDNLIKFNIIVMDNSLPGIIGLIYNDLAPLEAYELANKGV
ncbi:YbjN domain-containing protein [Mucilaginibacter sp. cycad4]|uniref:YbjN domain-containing protein n=1 Tax=Mucilaginibacter sp. cycad4 TaxID=3342096 RepID=UPI002AAA6CA4|nr:YbjN domain-containing protein [Mucilaginibacter gossypii]WPU98210.1 YbjN domain-containing protein [Mucilaginibacter gossypii]